MGGIDYVFVQNLVDFGRGLAGQFVGQPFLVYRLNPASAGDIVVPPNLVDNNLRAKVTHNRKVTQIENEYLHTNPFEFLVDSERVQIGDILVQNDPTYGGNAMYAVASKRPLKPVICVRTESFCEIYRPDSGKASGYSGRTNASDRPFILVNGQFDIGTKADMAAVVPCGVQNIGQMKNREPENLPMGTTASWWYVYVPALPGLDRIKENDIIVQHVNLLEPVVRYRVNQPYNTPVGTAGQYLLCERLTY